jgi:parallel beta-helix repeat protein
MQKYRKNSLLKRSVFFSVAALLLSMYAASVAGFAPIAAYANHADTDEDPTVQITKPVQGSTLADGTTITVEGTAFDRGHVKVVKVRVDDGPYKITTPNGDGDWSTWSTTVDITATGSHTIVAKVYDKAGHYSWNRVPIVIANSSSNSNDTSTSGNSPPPTSPPPSQEDNDTIPAALRTVSVSSISELMDAIKAAQPGDHIVLADGVYDTTEWLDKNSVDTMLVNAKGTEDAPIVIAAQTVGGAEIKGPAGFQFVDASHLVIQGFKFTFSQGDSRGIAVECDTCQHVRFTQNHFELAEESEDDNADWLGITSSGSDYNRIDHNTFVNKNTLGNFILIRGSDGVMPQYNRIDHNSITHQNKYIENGGECVRIGSSEYATSPAYTTVEYNHFEACNADAEVVSVKSSDNIIRYNTFTDNEGSLVLRHGNDNLVEGNYFINNAGGLRVYGLNQKIINNYFEGNHGDSVEQTFVIGSGTAESDADNADAGYVQPHNILVQNNTLVNNESHIIIGYGDDKPLPPKDVKFVNNTIVGSSGNLVTNLMGDNITWEGNILFGDGASPGDIPQDGYQWKDPGLPA